MILIDHPYVSDFLIETIKSNRFPIVSTKAARDLISEENLNWISEKEAIQAFKENPNQLIYSNSENVISWVENKLDFTKLPSQIDVFKDKIKFRELLKDVYPNYFFKGIPFEDLDSLPIDKMPFPFIIKPSIGFFSLGVHKVDEASEWPITLEKIQNEIHHIKDFYPSEVLNTNNFIIEECIEGEEYAVDCYYNEKGEAVVLNIMHHIFSSGKDVSDRIYSTSKEIIETNLPIIQQLVNTIGTKTNLKNFPIHIEVRIDKNETIIPIEVNPMRFGGWCTTSDISHYAYGINSYQYFLNQQKPNWNEILKAKKGKTYSLVLLDNNSGIEAKNIKSFNYNQLLADFENPLLLRKIDVTKFPIFGFLFTETSKGNEGELNRILKSNLTKYITLKLNNVW
ncbi:ATP-grasp domain-containing protein [Lutibacter sp. TH_r2]|uniref:ATP-grasp domain-containing protein n=1 Tax=Lutibacter sp. TH_r2 TaxID=3082083 RepID=UPI002955703B|nr:ATP-grasp domain-containing protein [Lutibacter sp. TH_r2]MDV7186611.1 ATP-grasp domain-containing protein [Lutibacter sp. TH_r2]